jgi:hypothetical protein
MTMTNDSYQPALALAHAAGRHVSTIHRWRRRGFVHGAIRGTRPGCQPWLIPATEVARLTTTKVMAVLP